MKRPLDVETGVCLLSTITRTSSRWAAHQRVASAIDQVLSALESFAKGP